MASHPDAADTELALRTSRGDRDAFAEFYNRHFRAVYDLVYRMVRDQDVAADIAQNTFIRAWENLQKRRVSGNVRAWLLTIARNTAINEIKRRKRWRALAADDPEGKTPLVFEAIDASRLSNPEAVVDDQELVDLVWTSAAALGPKDYSLLDMHLRKDLSASELAASLGLSSARVHVMLSRMRSTLEESVAVSLLSRRGRRDCSQLNDILAGEGGALSPEVRLGVRRHLKDCELCAESRKRFVAPAEIFSGLALLPVTDALIAGTWARISPLLVPAAAGPLVFLAAAIDRLGHWWAGAGIGVKAASVAALATVVVLPVGVSLVVVSGGGAHDSGGPTNASRQIRLTSPSPEAPAATAQSDGSDTAAPTPLVAGVVTSPGATSAPTETPGSVSTPLAGQAPASQITGATSTPPPLATPPPNPTPPSQPTSTPSASNHADVTVVNVVLTSSGGVAGQQFLLSATALLRNLGGASSAIADASFALTAPAGCAFAPAAPVTVQDRTLPFGTEVSVTRTWSVTCSSVGDHSFSVGASVAIDVTQPLTDPNPGNNANSGALIVTVLS